MQTFKERRIKPIKNSNGYLVVCFRRNSKKVTIPIHKLVAKYFISNNNNYNIVDHIDGNKLNNSVTNLRWVTQKENLLNHNTFNKQRESIIRVRKSEIKPVYQLDDNYNVIREFNSVEEAAEIFHCTAPLIRKCCKVKHYKGKGFHWSYCF